MKGFVRHLIRSVIIITLLSVLVGCRNDEVNNNQSGYSIDSIITDDLPEYSYLAQFVPIPDEIGEIVDVCITDDKIFIPYMTHVNVEYKYNEKQYDIRESGSVIYSMDTDGTNFSKLIHYTPALTAPTDTYGGSVVLAMYIDNAGYLWVVETWQFYRYNLPVDYNKEIMGLWELWEFSEIVEAGCAVRKLDSAGTELLSINISSILEQYGYLNVIAMCVDELQNVYLCLNDTNTGGRPIILIDSIENNLYEIDSISWVDRFVYLSDGTVAFRVMVTNEDGDTSLALQVIDPVSKSLGNVVYLPVVAAEKEIFTGGYVCDFIFADGEDLSVFELDKNQAEELLRWNDLDIIFTRNEDILYMTMVSDGRIFCIRRFPGTYRTMYQYELIVLTNTSRFDIPNKTMLTLGTVGNISLDMRNYISNFNRTSPDFRIEIRDYTEYNIGNSTNEALERFIIDITTGNVPDIVTVANLPYREYASRGVFANLWSFIDFDHEYARSDFVDSIFQAVEINECLYQVFPTFGIRTILGNSSIVGTEIGWNIDDFNTTLLKYPEADIPMGVSIDKEGVLSEFVNAVMDDYIDWDVGTVRFDSEDFIQLLELINNFAATANYENQVITDEAITNGRQLMTIDTVWCFNHYPGLKELHGENFVLKGFPTENRNGNVIEIVDGLAIIESSDNKEGAWEFVRTLLEKNSQLPNGRFPTNEAAFNQKASDEIEDGIIFQRENPRYLPFVEADLKQIINLLDSSNIRGDYYTDNSILYIINEEASNFFLGECTAQDAARIIQSRVSILVSERN